MKLIDYLPYYIGCDVITTDDNETAELVGVTDDDAHLVHKGTGSYGTCSVEGIKPILRKLESMTREEAKYLLGFKESEIILNIRKTDKYYNFEFKWADNRFDKGYGFSERAIGFNNDDWKPWQFHYLLRQHFDLFGLIDAGLAIDAKTIQ